MRKSILESPVLLAALIAAAASVGVAVAGAIGGGISAYYQRETDREKLAATLVMSIAQVSRPEVSNYAAALLRSGVLPDPEGSICAAFVARDCPIEVVHTRN